MSKSTQAATVKYHRLGGLKNGYLFLMFQEAGKSKIKVLADSFSSGRQPPPGLQTVTFSPCPHMRERASSGLYSPIMGAPYV